MSNQLLAVAASRCGPCGEVCWAGPRGRPHARARAQPTHISMCADSNFTLAPAWWAPLAAPAKPCTCRPASHARAAADPGPTGPAGRASFKRTSSRLRPECDERAFTSRSQFLEIHVLVVRAVSMPWHAVWLLLLGQTRSKSVERTHFPGFWLIWERNGKDRTLHKAWHLRR